VLAFEICLREIVAQREVVGLALHGRLELRNRRIGGGLLWRLLLLFARRRRLHHEVSERGERGEGSEAPEEAFHRRAHRRGAGCWVEGLEVGVARRGGCEFSG